VPLSRSEPCVCVREKRVRKWCRFVRCRPKIFLRLRRAYQASGGACGEPKNRDFTRHWITRTADPATRELIQGRRCGGTGCCELWNGVTDLAAFGPGGRRCVLTRAPRFARTAAKLSRRRSLYFRRPTAAPIISSALPSTRVPRSWPKSFGRATSSTGKSATHVAAHVGRPERPGSALRSPTRPTLLS
jgi:hypothetical protein